MPLYEQFNLRPLKRTPVTGQPALIGYDRLTRSQRAALNTFKILGKAFLLFLLVMALLWMWL